MNGMSRIYPCTLYHFCVLNVQTACRQQRTVYRNVIVCLNFIRLSQYLCTILLLIYELFIELFGFVQRIDAMI